MLAAAVLAALWPGTLEALARAPALAAACLGAALRLSDPRSVRVCSIAAAAVANKAGELEVSHRLLADNREEHPSRGLLVYLRGHPSSLRAVVIGS